MSKGVPDFGNEEGVGGCEEGGQDVVGDSPERVFAEKHFEFQAHVVLWVGLAGEKAIE